jgi:hypothetical protein
MTVDPSPTDTPAWGTPQPTAQRWGLRETVTAIGVAAVIAGLGGAAIYAATGNSHTGQGFLAHGAPPGLPPAAGGSPGAGGPKPGVPPALHGEFVVGDGAGGFATMLTQSGTVTQISPTAITVRSTDSYTQTYVLPPGVGAPGTIVTEDDVELRAKRTGQTLTVTAVSQQFNPGGPGFSGPPPGN